MNTAWFLDLFRRDPGAKQAPLPLCPSTRLQVWLVGAITSLFCTCLYIFSVAPSLGLGHDTGELTTCCVVQGVPHSPGYPLFTALGWLATQLPLDAEPAYKINLLCALETGLAMGFLGAGLALATRPWPALLGALLAGTCTAIWRQAVVTEVFALHLLFLCILIWLAILWEISEDVKRREILLITSFILGCCLAHQHIIALAAPCFVLFGVMAKGRGRAWGFSWLNLPVFLAAFLLPYALQMYFARQNPPLNWEDVKTLDHLIDHFLRKSYGTGLLNSAALQTDSRAGDAQVTAFWISVVRSYYPFPAFVFMLLSLDRLIANKFQPRLLLFVGLAFVYGPVFAMLGNQPTQEFFADMMERFYSSSTVGMAGMIALGLDWLAYHLRPEWARFLPAGLLMVLYSGVSNYPKSSQTGVYHAVDMAAAQFAQLPPRSALLIGGDLPAGAADYYRYALGKRRETVVILTGLASAPWFRDRLPAGLGRAAEANLPKGAEVTNEAALQKMVDYLQARGVEVYTNQIPPGLKGEFTRFGLLWRFRGKQPAWTKEQTRAEMLRVFKILQSCPRRGPQGLDWRQNFWIRFCLAEWLTAYRDLAQVLAETDPEAACKAMDEVIKVESVPSLASSLNRAALRLRLKRYAEAIEDYEVCLRLDSESRLALVGMIEAQNGIGDKAAANVYEKRLQALPQ